MLDIHKLFYNVDADPEEAKRIATASEYRDDRIDAIAAMDTKDPWHSIARQLKEKDEESWKEKLVSMMDANIREMRRQKDKGNRKKTTCEKERE